MGFVLGGGFLMSWYTGDNPDTVTRSSMPVMFTVGGVPTAIAIAELNTVDNASDTNKRAAELFNRGLMDELTQRRYMRCLALLAALTCSGV